MSNKILERVLKLTADGYEIRIRPDVFVGLELRLTKDNHTVAQVIAPDKIALSKFWNSDEEWFLYILTELEYRYLDYVSKIKEHEL